MAVRSRSFALAAALLMAAACDTSTREWQKAATANTIAGYEQFLTKHPGSAQSVEAEARIEALSRRAAIDSAMRTGTTEALERVLARYPRDPSAPKIREKLETRYFEEASAIDTIAAWEAYLAAHAASPHAIEAHDRLQAIFEERLPDFREAKTIRIEVSEDYGEASGVALPFKRVAGEILPNAGIRIVDGEADAVLAVRSNGEPYGGNYNSFGVGDGRYLYTGVFLSGTITLRAGSSRLSESFEHEISTPFSYTTSGTGPTSPSSAPFDTAFNETVPVTMRLLVGRVFGPSPLLSEMIASSGPSNPSASARALGNLKPPPTERLIAILRNDHRPAARSAAALALGEARAPEAAKPLLEAVRADASIRSSVTPALARVGGPAVPLLIDSLGDPNNEVMLCAVEALGQIGDPRAAAPLMAKLAAKDARARCRVVESLGKLASPAALNAVVAQLADADAAVRACSAQALAVDEVEDEDDWEKRDIRDLLAGNRDPRIAEGLLHGLDSAAGADAETVQTAIVSALNAIGDPVVPRLIEALKHQNAHRRAGAALALGGFWGDDRAIAALTTALRNALTSPDGELAAAASEALGKLADERGVRPLIAAIDSSNDDVRSKAILALGSIGDERAIAPLKKLKARGKSANDVDTALSMLEPPEEY